jgi:hypothetical protein
MSDMADIVYKPFAAAFRSGRALNQKMHVKSRTEAAMSYINSKMSEQRPDDITD